eukprot:2435397-Amphidinium_carterae.1
MRGTLGCVASQCTFAAELVRLHALPEVIIHVTKTLACEMSESHVRSGELPLSIRIFSERVKKIMAASTHKSHTSRLHVIVAGHTAAWQQSSC